MEGFGKIFTLLALVAAASAAATSFASISTAGGAAGLFQVGQKGVVTNTTRCGGYGTPIQLRVSDCEGRCSLIPGKVYDIEWDFFPSSAASSLSIACDLVFAGTPLRLFESVLPNSSVQPGLMYTIRFSVVPNDVLSGDTIKLRAIIYHTDNRLLELCIDTEVDMLEIP